jgi:hypothetical protein
MSPVLRNRPDALFAGASRQWIRLLPWGVAFALCVTLLPTTIGLLSADYELNGGLAGVLAVAPTAPVLLAVICPLEARYVVFAADLLGGLALLIAEPRGYAWPFPPWRSSGMSRCASPSACVSLGARLWRSGWR